MGRHRRKEKLSGCACPFFQREIIMGRDVRFLCRCGAKETAHHAPAYRCRKEKGSSDGGRSGRKKMYCRRSAVGNRGQVRGDIARDR